MYSTQIQRQQLYRVKKHKDLGFLMQINEQKINQNITKYSLVSGKGDVVKDLKLSYTIYYSYEKFDYTGKSINKVFKKAINFPLANQNQNNLSPQERLIYICLLSMRLNQKSWFNIALQKDISTNEQTDLSNSGHHYQITIEQMTLKNQNSYLSKITIYEQNRQKGKKYFLNKNYKQSLKYYKNSINILTGLSKKLFKPEEIKVLNQYAEKSQSNYLKCVAKLNGIGDRYDKQIAQKTKALVQKFMKKYPNSPNSYYQKAIYLKYQNKFGDAEQAINEGLKQKFDQNQQEASKQRNSLKHMLQEIRSTKQRNIRHLKREQIRKLKLIKRNNQNWNDSDDSI